MSSYLGWLVGALTSVPGNVGECTGSLATCDSLRNDGARLQVDGPSGVGIGFAPDNITGSLRVDTLRRGAEASGVGSNCSWERLPRVPPVPRLLTRRSARTTGDRPWHQALPWQLRAFDSLCCCHMIFVIIVSNVVL